MLPSSIARSEIEYFPTQQYFPPWLSLVMSDAIGSYILQRAILCSIFWISWQLIANRFQQRLKHKRSRSWYAVLTLVLRSAAAISSFIPHPNDTSVSYALTYISLLDAARFLVNDGVFRHMLVVQIIVMSIITLVFTFAAHCLPLLVVNSAFPFDLPAICSVFFNFLAISVSAGSPREWLHPNTASLPAGFACHATKEDTSSWFDIVCSFQRMTPLLSRSWDSPISLSDLEDLPYQYQPKVLLHQVKPLRKRYGSTARVLFSLFWAELFTSSLCGSMFFVSELIIPLAMYQLLEYLRDSGNALFQPYVWLIIIWGGQMMGTIFQQQMAFYNHRMMIKLNIALTGEIYDQAMISYELDPNFLGKSGKASISRSANGSLINLISTDVKTIMQGRILILVISGGPVGFVVGLVSLYRIIGWPCLVGLGITLIGSPITAWLSERFADHEDSLKDAQDTRISRLTEYLRAITIVKYLGWEGSASERIQESRSQEQNHLWDIAVLSTMMDSVAYCIPALSLIVIFGLYIIQGKTLTAAVAYTTISLFEIIRDNANVIAVIGKTLPKIRLAMQRIDRLFAAASTRQSHAVGDLKVENATFRRNKAADFLLQDINIDFVYDGLNIITGANGSGKTTLLLSLLGETILEQGKLTKPGNIGYVSQNPWLQAKSIKENIMFMATFNKERYDKVIKECCLEEDLQDLLNGDETNVGENGQALSGGQRARVAFARALYSDAPVLLLDNVFSALDTKTTALLWNRTFCNAESLTKGRTVVLVTQVLWMPDEADLVISLADGNATSKCQKVSRQPRIQQENHQNDTSSDFTVDRLKLSSEEKHDGKDEDDSNDDSDVDSEDDFEEEPNEEKIRVSSWLAYVSLFGSPVVILATFATLILYICTEMGTTYWISKWVDAGNAANDHASFYLVGYLVLGLTSTFTEALAALAFMRGSWMASKKLHSKLLSSFFNTNLLWLQKTPIGKILNRFSGDIEALDQEISEPIKSFLDHLFKSLLLLAAITHTIPLIVAPSIIIAVVGAIIGAMNTRAMTKLKEVASESESPIISYLSETLDGMATIRSRNHEHQDLFNESINQLLFASAKASATLRDCGFWLKFRIGILGAIINLFTGLFALYKSKGGNISAGLLGFSLTQAALMSSSILTLVFKVNDLNLSMQALHRVEEYCILEPEESSNTLSKRSEIDASWPQTPTVEFQNATIRYTLDGPDILKNFSMVFKAGERTAIVGRTGSGKTTVIQSILGFTHIISGKILIDGVDITTIPRQRLRSAIAIVPQEPSLFQGTIRSNLDPGELIESTELQIALDKCTSVSQNSIDRATEEKIATVSTQLSLDDAVSVGGSNFSQGQRQLISLCRALVRKSQLMLLDEATSSIDHQTDAQLQHVLQAEMQQNPGQRGGLTLIAVAHRLESIMEYDRIVVIAFGEVVESGTAEDLATAKGLFYKML